MNAKQWYQRVVATTPLPPPPLSLLDPPNSLDSALPGQASRVRSFPHVDGNYALHVYIPVFIPVEAKKELGHYLKKVTSFVPSLHVVNVDIPLSILSRDDLKLKQVALGRKFHISLGRTVAVRVHQINSMVAMLRQKLQLERRFWIDFNKWEVFVNDDHTRTFLSLEVTSGGLAEITKQIQAVDEVYKLHNLPEFYKVLKHGLGAWKSQKYQSRSPEDKPSADAAASSLAPHFTESSINQSQPAPLLTPRRPWPRPRQLQVKSKSSPRQRFKSTPLCHVSQVRISNSG